MRLRLFGTISIAVTLIELVLCFAGPLAFIQRPSLLLFPAFSHGLEEEQVAEITELIEQKVASTNSFSIVSQRLIADYFLRTDPGYDGSKLEPVNYIEAREIAKELELDRFAIAVVLGSKDLYELSIIIRDVKEEEVIRSGRFTADSFEHLLAGIGRNNEDLEFEESLRVDTKGVSFTDWLVLGLLVFQLAVGILAFMKRGPGNLPEIIWVPLIVLFLFTYIYALNANMDYIQRFIAHEGRIQLAGSTALEQLFAFARYGPLLILNGWYYFAKRRLSSGKWKREKGQNLLHRWVARWSLPWVLLSVCLFSLSFPSIIRLKGFGFLAWFSLVPLFLVLISSSWRWGVFYGVTFGTLQVLLVNYWHGTYSYVTLHLVTIVFFVEFLLFMVPFVWLIQKSGRWGYLVAPAGWVVFEFLRSIGVLGYPWILAGASQYRFVPFIQFASVTGIWGVSFVVILCNSALAWFIVRVVNSPFRENRQARAGKWIVPAMPPILVFLGVMTVCLVFGIVMISRTEAALTDEEIPRARIVLIQQNTDPRKHEYGDSLDALKELTDTALSEMPEPPDLVVWSESAFMLDIRYWMREDKQRWDWAELVREFIEYQLGLETWLLTGTQDHRIVSSEGEEEEKEYFNTAILLDPGGVIRETFHKMHLVPFSEHFPLDKERFSGLLELFQKYDISDWVAGEERVVFRHEKFRFIAPICFEDVFSDDIRRFILKDVDIIINICNDYWSLSPVEGTQHAYLALFRAVENRRPILRATSSGYSIYADAAGRLQPGSPAPYTAGHFTVEVPVPDFGLTVYTRLGDWFPTVCGAAVLLTGVILVICFLTGIIRTQRIVERKQHGEES